MQIGAAGSSDADASSRDASGNTNRSDRLVVLRTLGDKLHAAKTHTLVKGKKGNPDNIKTKGYSEAKHFSVEEIAVANIGEYHDALDRLTRDPHALIIRGAPKDDINRDHTRRLLHPNGGDPATFEPVPRCWLMCDFDHQPEPPLTDLVTRPVEAALHIVGRLPPEFQDVTFFYQWGSSQGLPSDAGFLSLHTWFWCARFYSDDELARLASFINRSGQIIDPAVFCTVQVNYIAAPLFIGFADPLPQRHGIWRGLEDELELIIPPPAKKDPTSYSSTGYEPGLGVDHFLAQIGGAEGFRWPILQAISSFVAIYGIHADPRPLYRDIRATLDRVEPGWRADPKGQRYDDDKHLDQMHAWICLQHGNQPAKGQPRPIPEPPPWPEPPPPEPEPGPPDLRPTVYTGGGRLHAAVDEAEKILVESDPEVYAFGDQIVRTAPSPIAIADNKTTIGPRLLPVTPEHMADRFSRLINFCKYNAKSKQGVPIDSPRVIATTFLARVGLWRVPQLKALATCPLLLADGRILDRPGFDAASGILFDAQRIQFPSVPQRPTRADAAESLNLLMHPFRDYPFVDDASKSVLRSLLLSAVSRFAYPFVPCHAFDATGAGTGKSKLFDCASILLTGRECAVVSQPDDAAEFEKKLFAELLAGASLVSIDNCNLPLDHPFLCMTITQPFVKSRLLGLSKNPEIPNSVILGANGNNFSFAGDMLRRGLTGRLDAGVEKPWERVFSSEDPVVVFKRARPKLVAAALTVLRGYIAAGRPRMKAPPLGGFEGWCHTVREAILWLGAADPCLTIESARKADPARQQLEAVVTQWCREIGDRSVTAREVIEACEAKVEKGGGYNGTDPPVYIRPDFRNALLDVAALRGRLDSKRLGAWLGNKAKGKVVTVADVQGRPHQARIVADPPLDGYGRWRLEERQTDGNWR